MSQPTTRDTSQYTDNKEHNPTFSVKNVMPYGYDGINAVAIKVDPSGNLTGGSAVYNIKITESGNYTYIGKAPVGTAQATAGWQAFRIDENTSGQTLILYADGNANFDNVCTDLTSLSYS